MNKSLTQPWKKKNFPIIVDRDGFLCLYDNKPLTRDYIFEHLNGNRQDNRIENIVLAHQKCNIEKITNLEYQLIAEEKLQRNEEMSLHYMEDPTAFENNSSEININQAMRPFTEKWITERMTIDGRVELTEATNCIVYHCQKNYAHGAEPTIRRYIKELTCSESDWQVVKDDKNIKWICQRNVLN